MSAGPQLIAAENTRRYINTRLAEEISELAAREKRLKDKYVEACAASLTAGDLVVAQRDRIQDLEDWMRDICKAPSIVEAHRLAHEALW